MAGNLFISCVLHRPERTYDKTAAAIHALDETCVEIHFALWHIRTAQSPAEVRDRLKPALDANDQLIVIDASNGKTAWINLPKKASDSLRELGS